MTRVLVLFSTLLLLLSACQGEKKEDASSKVPETSARETSAGDTTKAPTNAETTAPAENATAEAVGGEDAPAEDDCVAKCVQRNQMKAVGADQIERDCEAECKK